MLNLEEFFSKDCFKIRKVESNETGVAVYLKSIHILVYVLSAEQRLFNTMVHIPGQYRIFRYLERMLPFLSLPMNILVQMMLVRQKQLSKDIMAF